mmetsp:Transcript_39955/g.55541  ORF Transcript_39955/g.55541 Transcript_39955/m.55541 type:complete len:151 (-) Transcript_39955:93-545(-)
MPSILTHATCLPQAVFQNFSRKKNANLLVSSPRCLIKDSKVRRSQLSLFFTATKRNYLRVYASDKEIETANDSSSASPPSAPPLGAPSPGFTSTDADGKEMTVGPVTNFLGVTLLIILFGLSFFFTFSRQFLPDLAEPAKMDLMWIRYMF